MSRFDELAARAGRALLDSARRLERPEIADMRPPGRRRTAMAAGVLGFVLTLVAVGTVAILLRTPGSTPSPGESAQAPSETEEAVWQSLAEAPITERYLHSAVWSGDEMIVWGGVRGISGQLDPFASDGAAYSPDAGAWRTIAVSPLRGRARHTAVWTGELMIVWGGEGSPADPADGAAYDPDADEWRRIADAGVAERWGHTATWIGEEMIVFGGRGFGSDEPVGLAYDLGTDRWRALPESSLGNRVGHAAVWTGTELVIWGGWVFDPAVNTVVTQNSGAAYNPRTGTWRSLPEAPLAPRYGHSAVWTGSEMLVWGGSPSLDQTSAYSDGAAYDPAEDAWRPLPDAPLEGRYDHAAFWTHGGMLVWGGHVRTSGSTWREFADGAIWDPSDGDWKPIPAASATGTLEATPSVWTGTQIIYWGRGDDFQTAGGASRRVDSLHP